MFKTQLVPGMENGMFVKYRYGTREEYAKVRIECLEHEYEEHKKRMQEIKREIEELEGELCNDKN